MESPNRSLQILILVDDKYCLQTFCFLGGVPGRHWSQQTHPRYKGGSINAPLAIPLSFYSWYVLL